MRPYGDKRRSGYHQTTRKSSCGCCNGSYAKVGRASNRHNAMRGLKKSARQDNKKQLIEDIEEDTISRWDYQRSYQEYGYELIEGYNYSILIDFANSLKRIAPELAWADTTEADRNYWYVEARGLDAIPQKYKKHAPQTTEDWTELLEKIIRERDAKRD